MKFFPTALLADHFSWEAVASLVNAAALAYKSEAALQHQWHRIGARVLQTFSVGAVQGYVVEAGPVLLCALRGTDSPADWIANLDISPRSRDYGSAHAGFLGAYGRVAPLVEGYVRRAADAGTPLWLTGHSFGGALAQIAAQENALRAETLGVMTFGQPRTGNVDPFHDLTRRLALGYRRVVYGADYVPRIPPNFAHTGTLVALRADAESGLYPRPDDRGGDELPAIPEQDFARHRRELLLLTDALNAQSSVAEDVPSSAAEGALLSATAARILPGLRDHRIANYVGAILRQVPSETRRLESSTELLRNIATPRLRSVARPRGGGPAMLRPRMVRPEMAEIGFGMEASPPDAPAGAPTTRMPHVLRLLDGSWTPPTGVEVQSAAGDFRTVLATPEAVERFKHDPMIDLFEPSRDAGIEDLDASVPYVKGNAVQVPPMDERGDAALVGIVDTGIDILHEAFDDGAGGSRILAIWDQADTSGPSPAARDPAFTQNTGTLHLAADIAGAIRATALGTAPSPVLRDAGSGHGTHVAGIAAGRATALSGPGMAPEAGVIVVIPNMVTHADDPNSLGYSVSHLDAVSFLRDASRGGNAVLSGPGQPIAVNMSLGMNAGAHDGSTLLERMMDALTQNGGRRGFAIVKSAGNERNTSGHAWTRLFLGMTDIVWHSHDVDRDLDYFEGWFSADDDVGFRLTTPQGGTSARVDLSNRTWSETLDGNLCQMKLTGFTHDNGHRRLVITISPSSVPILRKDWTLTVEGDDLRSDSAEFHLWVERIENRAVTFTKPDESVTISIPGTADHVICVGACDTGARPRLTQSTSFGLTRVGGDKPDIAAPGAAILSARANDADHAAVGQRSGTSMAAPHVTGALALAMSRRAKSGKAQLNAVQLRRALTSTGREVSRLFHPGFGHGILDCEAFMRAIDQEP